MGEGRWTAEARHMAGTGRLRLERRKKAWEVGVQVLEQQDLPHCLIASFQVRLEMWGHIIAVLVSS